MKSKAIRLLSLVVSSRTGGPAYLLSVLRDLDSSAAARSIDAGHRVNVDHNLEMQIRKASLLLSRLAMHLYDEVDDFPRSTDDWNPHQWFQGLAHNMPLRLKLLYVVEVLQLMDQIARNFSALLLAQVITTLGNQFWSVLHRILALCELSRAESTLVRDMQSIFVMLKRCTTDLERTFRSAQIE